MLAALLHAAARRAGLELSVASAGLAAAPGMPASEHSITCMRALGLDLSDHRSRPVDLLEAQHADLVLCLGPRHAEVLQRNGVPRERLRVIDADAGGVPDPFGADLASYQACTEVLEEAVQKLIAQLSQ